MNRITSKRPSVTTAIALIALFAALGGTSYAATLISGKQVKDSSLTGADVKNSTLGGADIKDGAVRGTDVLESSLGQVPNAARANTAGRADSAATADKATKATSADKATLADKATKADTATTANSATTAGTAQNVGTNGVSTDALQNGSVTAPKLAGFTRRTNDTTIPSGTSDFVSVSCAAGERAISGGSYWNGVAFTNANSANLRLLYGQVTGANSYQARGYNNTGDNTVQLQVSVVCLAG